MKWGRMILFTACIVAWGGLVLAVADSADSQAWIKQGTELEGKGNLYGALKAYKKAINADPNSAQPYQRLGCVYRSLGKPKDALRAFQKGAQIAPDNALGHFYLGRLFFEMGRNEDAKIELALASNKDPQMVDAIVLMAVIKKNEGDVGGAIELLKNAIKISPDSFAAHANLGNIYIDRKLWPEAMREFQEAVRIDDTQAESRRNLGFVCMQMGKIDKAISELSAAVRIAPGYAVAYYNLAEAYSIKGLKGEAIWNYRKFLQMSDPERDLSWRLKAMQEIQALEKAGFTEAHP